MGKKGKKRNKSQASPGDNTGNEEKRLNMSLPAQNVLSPQPQVQTPLVTGSPYPHGSIPIPPYYSPTQYFGTPAPTQVTYQQSTHPGVSMESIHEKLERIEKRLSKLDTIEKQLSCMSSKISSIDNRVTSLERSVNDNNTKLTELEVSRNLDASICSELQNQQKTLDSQLKDERTRVAKLSADIIEVQKLNEGLSEEVIDLQSRSMRDNLLFFGIGEYTTPKERQEEDCITKILTFCTDVLEMPDARDKIKIDRAHRIGQFSANKKRPIVVKFNYFQDKLTVKRKAFELLKESPFSVADQYPKAIQERRKELYPKLKEARLQKKEAFLNYDTLYINGQKFKATGANNK